MELLIEPADLAAFATIEPAKAEAMIADAEALALLAAPCLSAGELTLGQRAAVKAILRTAILRWNDAGSGALSQESAGPFAVSYDTRQRRYGGLTDGECARLRAVCGGGVNRRVFTVGQAPADGSGQHVPWCNVAWGAACSCGTVLAGYPLYEMGG